MRSHPIGEGFLSSTLGGKKGEARGSSNIGKGGAFLSPLEGATILGQGGQASFSMESPAQEREG